MRYMSLTSDNSYYVNPTICISIISRDRAVRSWYYRDGRAGSQAKDRGCDPPPRIIQEVKDMVEKRKLLQVFTLLGENLSEGNPILKAREEKILFNLFLREKKLRAELGKKGMLPKPKEGK